MGLTENQALYLMQKEIDTLKRKLEVLIAHVKVMEGVVLNREI